MDILSWHAKLHSAQQTIHGLLWILPLLRTRFWYSVALESPTISGIPDSLMELIHDEATWFTSHCDLISPLILHEPRNEKLIMLLDVVEGEQNLLVRALEKFLDIAAWLQIFRGQHPDVMRRVDSKTRIIVQMEGECDKERRRSEVEELVSNVRVVHKQMEMIFRASNGVDVPITTNEVTEGEQPPAV